MTSSYNIAHGCWPCRDHEMFASMQLMKPFSTKAPPSRSSVSRKEVLHMMEKAKNRVRHLLEGMDLACCAFGGLGFCDLGLQWKANAANIEPVGVFYTDDTPDVVSCGIGHISLPFLKLVYQL